MMECTQFHVISDKETNVENVCFIILWAFSILKQTAKFYLRNLLRALSVIGHNKNFKKGVLFINYTVLLSFIQLSCTDYYSNKQVQ